MSHAEIVLASLETVFVEKAVRALAELGFVMHMHAYVNETIGTFWVCTITLESSSRHFVVTGDVEKPILAFLDQPGCLSSFRFLSEHKEKRLQVKALFSLSELITLGFDGARNELGLKTVSELRHTLRTQARYDSTSQCMEDRATHKESSSTYH